MSVAWVSSYPEQRRRAVSFATVLEPKKWLYAVKKLAYNRAVDDIDIYRSSRTGITCYEITSFISYNLEETEHQTLRRLFGEPFLKENLSYSNKANMGRYFKNFIRIQRSARNATKDDPISEDDFYVIYDTIDQNIIINTASHTACHKDFMAVPNINLEELVESVDSCRIFNELGKKHYLEGGSWLCMPRYANDLDHAITKCRRFYTHIVEEFITGCLREDYITRISYSSVKTLVKVSNNKTVYFDYRESHPERGPFHNEERIFRADREVRTVFLKLCHMKLSASLRYKPEVFTACKLNTRNTTSRLSLYSDIYHDRKMAIASE